MEPSLFTWNALAINDSNPFKSVIPPGQMANLSANAVTVPRAGDDPYLSDSQLTGHVFVIEVYIAAGANIATSRELVKKYFNVRDKTRHNLIIKDTADSDKQYYLTGFPVGVQPLGSAPKNGFAIRIAVEHPYWQLVTATADAWAITGTGDTQAITNAGNISVPPVITLTPTTTKGAGLLYRRYVSIYNNLDKSFIAPLDITSGGIDTAALTTAKMQADGDDFRVWLDSSFSDRWLDAMDSAATKCWVNFSLKSRKEGTLLTTVNAAATTLAFTLTRANLQFLRALKQVSNTTLLIESEALTFDTDNIDLINYQITSVSRGAKGTTAAGHTAPITVRHIEHDLWIMYGDSTLSAPDVDDDYKPIISLASTNASWVYSNYFDSDSHRSAMWQGGVQASKTGLSYVFTSNENAFADPSTELGLALVNYSDNRVMFEVGILEWLLSHPAGFTNVTYSGKKYYTGSWPAIAGLQYLQPNTAWFTASNESIPTVVDTWEAFGPTAVALGATYDAIRFAIDGALESSPNEAALIQFDTITLTIPSANLPTIAVGAEATINFFDFKITNNTTGEYILVTTPCPVDTVLTIDCAEKEAYLADGTRVSVRLSTDRESWLDLAAGANTLQFDDVGTVGITGVVTHRDRIL
ncbi:MAG TPA: hypothetical protein VFU31_05510 [Candidatus Binatia bacterium]|nr:hypothetical protein [Candidatus Binatia bacterium]